jgi:hypothetical protein
VPYQGPVIGHHIVLNYIDSNGFHHTLQGVPEHRFDHNIDKPQSPKRLSNESGRSGEGNALIGTNGAAVAPKGKGIGVASLMGFVKGFSKPETLKDLVSPLAGSNTS